jgi:NADH pyrophosphatase NudC (nudix superfamily)
MMEFCPRCGWPAIRFDGVKKLTCEECGWTYFHNVAAAVMAALTLDGKVLFAERAQEPAQGFLELPGGFVDPGESAEEAIRRELYEELGLEGLALEFVGTASNAYPYGDVTYQTCDVIFTAPLERLPDVRQPEELARLELLSLDEVETARIAFASVRTAIELLRG